MRYPWQLSCCTPGCLCTQVRARTLRDTASLWFAPATRDFYKDPGSDWFLTEFCLYLATGASAVEAAQSLCPCKWSSWPDLFTRNLSLAARRLQIGVSAAPPESHPNVRFVTAQLHPGHQQPGCSHPQFALSPSLFWTEFCFIWVCCVSSELLLQ